MRFTTKMFKYCLVSCLSLAVLTNAIYKLSQFIQKDCYTDNGFQHYISDSDDNFGIDNDDLENTNRDYNLVVYDAVNNTTSYENFDRNHYQKRNNGSINPTNCYIPNIASTMSGSSFIDNSSTDYYNNYIPPYYSWGTLGTDTEPIDSTFTSMQLVSPTTSFPYCTFGLTSSTFKRLNRSTNQYKDVIVFGSGSVIGPNTVLTCAHCFYTDVTKTYVDDNGVVHTEYEDDENNPCFPYSCTFYVGRNGSIYLMEIPIKRIYINYSYYNNPTFANDWAIIEFETNLGFKTGWNGVTSGLLTNQMDVEVHGYPGALGFHQYEDYGIVNELETDTKIYRCSYYSHNGVSGSGVKTIFTNTYSYICGNHVGRYGQYALAKQVNKFMVNLAASFLQSRGV